MAPNVVLVTPTQLIFSFKSKLYSKHNKRYVYICQKADEAWCQNEFGKCQRMSMSTHLKLDIRTSYLPSTPTIRMKFYEQSQLFSNLHANWPNSHANWKKIIIFQFLLSENMRHHFSRSEILVNNDQSNFFI